MFTTGSSALLPCKVKCLHNKEPLSRFQPSAIFQTGLLLAVSNSKQKNDQLSLRSQTFPSSLTSGVLGNRNRKMNNMVVCSGMDAGSAPPFPFNLIPGSNWQLWVLGTIVSVFLPFTTSKWGPLLKLKNGADNMIEAAEQIAERVEEVAEKVEKLADDIGDQIPEGTKLRDALELVEDLAEETAKNARLAGDLVDKVEEIEDKMEAFMESVDDKGKEQPQQKPKELVKEVIKEAKE